MDLNIPALSLLNLLEKTIFRSKMSRIKGPNKLRRYIDMADKTLACKDCNNEFIFTEGEQAFYQEKGFANEPQRCPDCRKARKQQRGGGGNRGGGGGFGGGNRGGGYGGGSRW